MYEHSSQESSESSALVLEMIFSAYKALATVYETACPGNYARISMMMKDYIADLFNHREAQIDQGLISSADFEDAVKRVRTMLLAVEEDVIHVSPSA